MKNFFKQINILTAVFKCFEWYCLCCCCWSNLETLAWKCNCRFKTGGLCMFLNVEVTFNIVLCIFTIYFCTGVSQQALHVLWWSWRTFRIKIIQIFTSFTSISGSQSFWMQAFDSRCYENTCQLQMVRLRHLVLVWFGSKHAKLKVFKPQIRKQSTEPGQRGMEETTALCNLIASRLAFLRYSVSQNATR